jgi:hypothetical protein
MSPKPVLIIAYILLVIGFIGLAWSFQPTEGSMTAELPSGDGYYSGFEVSLWLNGHIAGDFEVVSGDGTVRLFILDEAQYDDYSYDGVVSDSLYYYTGSSGSFSVDLPTTSTYYVVVDHGSVTTAQTVDIAYEVSGIDIIYLVGGAVLLAIGVVLVIVGMRMKAKAKAAEPPSARPEASGEVVMFDRKT